MVSAVNRDVEFSGNVANSKSNAIYNKGELVLEASNNKSIIINK